MSVRRLYTLCFYLAIPFLFLRLVWLGARHPGYRRAWPERLGYIQLADRGRPRLWVHAVSVGEAQAAAVLVRALCARFPHIEVVMTTTTPTGAECVARELGDTVRRFFFPFDLPVAMRRFLGKALPVAVVIMETELWPNLLAECRRQGVPVLLANARLSPRSFRGYQRIPGITRTLIRNVQRIAAQSSEDAERFVALGADPARVSDVGNIKFDAEVPARLLAEGTSLRREIGRERPVWIAGSTHEGEEALVLRAHAVVKDRHRQALLVLAPRHPQRFGRVFDVVRESGFQAARCSSGAACTPVTDVLLLDTMGDLAVFYGAADVAFVGGSLVEIGGHNPLEAARLAVPVVTGPHIANFETIYGALIGAGAAWITGDPEVLAARVSDLLSAPEVRREAGERGRQVVLAHRGAVGRIVAILALWVDDRFSPSSSGRGF
ncbi:MAG: lipid IV(A) 3-deoxy-D-manno-octulosonic acid transferase [Gammaproteobacteria bacterium]